MSNQDPRPDPNAPARAWFHDSVEEARYAREPLHVPAGADWRDQSTKGDHMNAQTETIEQEIQRKGLTAPRVTPKDIEANIASEYYFTAAEGASSAASRAQGDAAGGAGAPTTVMEIEVPAPLLLLTFCVLVLRNGFTVHGVSACASPENFNAELGKRIARENAVREMWPLMGYALREKLSNQGA